MNREAISNIIRFIVLILVQGVLLSNIDLWHGRMQIYLYILFIVMLPLRIPRSLSLFFAFALGLAVDMFYDSPGLHASAAVFSAFIRPYFIRALTPRDEYDITDRANISSMGLIWFLKLSTALIFFHSLWLFALESFGLTSFGLTMMKTISTAFITLIVSVIVVYLFSRNKNRT